MIDKFHQISIRGRYLYCYLCLRNVIISESFEEIPEFLNVILKNYTATSRLDTWQDSIDEVLPSVILNQENGINHYKLISYEQVLDLRRYYSKNELVTDVIENLIWLGISTLYVGFNSNTTFGYVKDVIGLMNAHKIDLPDFSIISSFSVNERGGWGNLVDIDDFLLGLISNNQA
jgi:hypothetical protein